LPLKPVKGHLFGARRLSLNFNRGIEIPHRLVDFQPEIALFYVTRLQRKLANWSSGRTLSISRFSISTAGDNTRPYFYPVGGGGIARETSASRPRV
jgi:hypothetical protein